MNRADMERAVKAGLAAEFREKDYSSVVTKASVSETTKNAKPPAPPPPGLKTGSRDDLKNALFACMGTKEDRAALKEKKEVKKPVKKATYAAPQASGGLLYEDGSAPEAGDIISDGKDLAEVTMVARNGLVLHIPVSGDTLVESGKVRNYKRVGKKRGC